MKVRITTASTCDTSARRLKEAGFKAAEIIRGNSCWYYVDTEINSLEELMELHERVDYPLIVDGSDITIYDDYIE